MTDVVLLEPPAGGASSGAATGALKPYKGLESFQVEDADLFYGRDREAEQLVARILGARLTVLHAQSGAGKTSLLNARVIPGLEAQGWTAARAIPQTDPVRAVTTTTLLGVLPPPDAERLALQAAWTDLGLPDSMGALLQEYDDLEKDDPRRRRLTAPVKVTTTVPWSGPAIEINAYPVFRRLLRSTVDLERYSSHLSVIRDLGACRSETTVDADTPVSAVVQTLTELASVYPTALERFQPAERSFDRFFWRLVQLYGLHVADFALVLLFDQAEELFTRFVDQPGRQKGMDWRLKWEFFDQLERLIGRRAPSDPVDDVLPVRFVISLRSEYIAQLDPVRSFAWELDSSSFHLGMLSKADAKSAVTGPAGKFDYGYTDDCSTRIVEELAREERYVEPAQLQIVCDKLWSVQGHLIAKAEGVHDRGEKPLIGLATLERLGFTKGILASFVGELLGDWPRDEQLETIELLEPLVTRGGTRNVASREDLVNERFRDVARRDALISRLVAAKILREERRLGGLFIEITHEFLIEPVLKLLKELAADTEYSRFRWALGALQQLAETGQDARSVGALRIGEFLALHDNRDRLQADGWAREVMLRSAVMLAHVIPEYRSPRDVVAVWARNLADVEATEPTLENVCALLSRGARLGPAELRRLEADRGGVHLTQVQARVALRSMLAGAIDAERDAVACWTKKVIDHEQPDA
jgi:hypothetical protein